MILLQISNTKIYYFFTIHLITFEVQVNISNNIHSIDEIYLLKHIRLFCSKLDDSVEWNHDCHEPTLIIVYSLQQQKTIL